MSSVKWWQFCFGLNVLKLSCMDKAKKVMFLWFPPDPLVEQIIAYGRRIVQIMKQATDLAHILYRGQPSRKKCGPRKISIWLPFSQMAAIGYPEILFFALNGQQMVEKDNYDKRFYVLSIANVQIMS